MQVENFIKHEAFKLGFSSVGIAPAREALTHRKFIDWLESGCAGEMRYLRKNAHLRENILNLLPDAKSVVVLGARYASDLNTGFSGYVSVVDYHKILRHKAELIAAGIEKLYCTANRDFKWRICVDSAPLPERELAVAAGLGWIGKNGYLVNETNGCLVLLCEILLNISLEPSTPTNDLCGNCKKCTQACPTGAIRSDRLIDARKCISYLTIEYKGVIDEALRPLMGNSIFGCDRCGAACPFNNRETFQQLNELYERPALPSAAECLTMTQLNFEKRFKGTVIHRTGLELVKRNASIALGNSGDKRAIPVLEKTAGMESDLIKAHAVWAIERLAKYI